MKINNYKNKNNLIFLYVLLIAIGINLFLIYDFILLIVNPLKISYGDLNISLRILNYFSFFTIQSNYFVCIYFYYFAFLIKKYNKRPNFIISLALTTYITITMAIFWLGIAPTGKLKEYQIWHLFGTITLHTIIPTIMIATFFLTNKNFFYDLDNHHKKNLWLILIYLLLYLIFIFVKVPFYPKEVDEKFCFPYFFLGMQERSNFYSMILLIPTILLFLIFFQYFYVWINNRIFFKKNKNKLIENLKLNNNFKYKLKFDKSFKTGIFIGIISSLINAPILFFLVWTNSYEENILILKILISFFILINFILYIFFIFNKKNIYRNQIIIGIITLIQTSIYMFNYGLGIISLISCIIIFKSISKK